jgi:hypothetical protein
MSDETPDFHEYLKKQLINYIKTEREKGTRIQDIEKVLLDVGHHKNIIDECFDEIRKEDAGIKVPEEDEPLKKDLVSDVKSSLMGFFGKLRTDKEVSAAKKEASPDEEVEIIEEAVEEVKSEERTFVFEGIIFFIYLIGLVLLVLFTSGSTGDDFVVVAAGFSASFINTFVSFAAMGFASNVPIYVFIPVIIGSIFYAVGSFGGLPIFKHMDMEALGIVNVFISLFFNILVINVAFFKPKPSKDASAEEQIVLEPEAKEAPEKQKARQRQQAARQAPPHPGQVHTAYHAEHGAGHGKGKKHPHIEDLRKEFKLDEK